MADITISEEELQKKLDEAALKALEPVKAELDKAKTDLETAQKALEGNDKDKNFAALRDAKDKAEAKVTELEGKITTIQTDRLKDIRTAVLDKLVGTDAETRKRVEDAYAEINGEANDTETITAKMTKAMNMAGVNVVPGTGIRNVVSAASGGRPQADTPVSTEAKSAAETFNKHIPNNLKGLDGKPIQITEEDLKKAPPIA